MFYKEQGGHGWVYGDTSQALFGAEVAYLSVVAQCLFLSWMVSVMQRASEERYRGGLLFNGMFTVQWNMNAKRRLLLVSGIKI